MKPLDLSIAPPRSPRAKLAGLSMLPRTIDRARASLPGGVLGKYDGIESGLSTVMLTALAISPAELGGRRGCGYRRSGSNVDLRADDSASTHCS